MSRCTECQTEWTFKDKAKALKKLSLSSIKCPYCGVDQFINLKSQKQMSLANIIIPVTMLLPIPFDMPLSVHIPLILIGIILVIVLNVLLIKLSKEREYII